MQWEVWVEEWVGRIWKNDLWLWGWWCCHETQGDQGLWRKGRGRRRPTGSCHDGLEALWATRIDFWEGVEWLQYLDARSWELHELGVGVCCAEVQGQNEDIQVVEGSGHWFVWFRSWYAPEQVQRVFQRWCLSDSGKLVSSVYRDRASALVFLDLSDYEVEPVRTSSQWHHSSSAAIMASSSWLPTS